MQPKKPLYRWLALAALFLAVGSLALAKYLYLIPHVQIHQAMIEIDGHSAKIVREAIYKGRNQSFLAQFWEPRLDGTNLYIEMPNYSKPIIWKGEGARKINAITTMDGALYVASTGLSAREQNCFLYFIDKWNGFNWNAIESREHLKEVTWLILGYNNKHLTVRWPGISAYFARPFGSLLLKNRPISTLTSKLDRCN